jgi:hypothetical protein
MKWNGDYSDLMAVGIGVAGALLKGLKSRLNKMTVLIGCIVAGILTYSATGIIEMYYSSLSPKIIILVSFSVGWLTNEITQKMDDFIGDVYAMVIAYIKTFFTKKP